MAPASVPNEGMSSVDDDDIDLGENNDAEKEQTNPDTHNPSALPPGVVRVRVVDPVKQGDGVNAFISFQVQNINRMDSFTRSHSTVVRRFSDFLWLASQLASEKPGSILPPLPERSPSAKVMRLSDEFIERRRQSLERFVQLVAEHPEVRESSALRNFLEASDGSTDAEEQQAHEAAHAHSGRWRDRVPNTVASVLKDLHQSTARFINRSAPIDSHEWDKTKKYYSNLESYLSELQRHVKRYLNRERKHAVSLTAFGEAMSNIGGCERTIARNLSTTGEKADEVANATILGVDKQLLHIESRLRDAVRHVGNVKQALNVRNQLDSCDPASFIHPSLLLMTISAAAFTSLEVQARQAVLMKNEACKAEISSREQRVAKMKHSNAKQEKISEQERELNAAKEHAERISNELKTVTTRLERELPRYQRERSSQLRQIFAELASAQAAMHRSNATSWHATLASLGSDIDSST